MFTNNTKSQRIAKELDDKLVELQGLIQAKSRKKVSIPDITKMLAESNSLKKSQKEILKMLETDVVRIKFR